MRKINAMSLAHEIRKELNMEGDYKAQMKYCLTKAWQVLKKEITIEEVLGIEQEAACTTNESESKQIIISDRYYVEDKSIYYVKNNKSFRLVTYKDISLKKVVDIAIFLSRCIPEMNNDMQKNTAKRILKNKITSMKEMNPNINKVKKITNNNFDKDELLLKKYKYIMTIHDGGVVFVTNRKGVTTCNDYSKTLNRRLTKKQTEMFIAKNISRFPKGGVIKHTYDFFGKTEGMLFIKESN